MQRAALRVDAHVELQARTDVASGDHVRRRHVAQRRGASVRRHAVDGEHRVLGRGEVQHTVDQRLRLDRERLGRLRELKPGHAQTIERQGDALHGRRVRRRRGERVRRLDEVGEDVDVLEVRELRRLGQARRAFDGVVEIDAERELEADLAAQVDRRAAGDADVAERREVQVEVDRNVEPGELVREVERDREAAVLVVHLDRLVLAPAAGSGGQLLDPRDQLLRIREGGRAGGVEQLLDVVAEGRVVVGRGLGHLHRLDERIATGPVDRQRESDIAGQLARGRRHDQAGQLQAIGGACTRGRLRSAEPELVVRRRSQAESGHRAADGRQDHLVLGDARPDQAVEPGVLQRLVEVGDELLVVVVVLAVAAVVEHHGAEERVAQLGDLAERRGVEGNVELGEQLAIGHLRQEIAHLPHELDEARGIDAAEFPHLLELDEMVARRPFLVAGQVDAAAAALR